MPVDVQLRGSDYYVQPVTGARDVITKIVNWCQCNTAINVNEKQASHGYHPLLSEPWARSISAMVTLAIQETATLDDGLPVLRVCG